MTENDGSPPDTPDPSVRGPQLSVGVLTVLAAVHAVLGGLLWVFSSVPDIVSPLLPLSSGMAAVAIGYDATNVQGAELWWAPRPWVWAFAMVPPILNLGFCAGYVWRRREVMSRQVPGEQWFRVVVAGVGIASGAVIALSNLLVAELATGPLAITLSAVGFAGTALTLVAVYFDGRYVAAVRAAADKRWLLGGYHWVPLLALFHPTNLLFLGVYYLRRRSLLSDVDDPDQLLRERDRENGRESPPESSVEG